MCLKAQVSPWAERTRRTRSRRVSVVSRADDLVALTRSRPGAPASVVVNSRPITDTRLSRSRSAAGSRSSRAARSAETVGGSCGPVQLAHDPPPVLRARARESRPRPGGRRSPRRRAGCHRTSRSRRPPGPRVARRPAGRRPRPRSRAALSGSRPKVMAFDGTGSPAGVLLEQLGPRLAEQEQRQVGHLLADPLEQLQQGRLGPVQVVDAEHQRAPGGELLQQSAYGPERSARRRSARRSCPAGGGGARRPGRGPWTRAQRLAREHAA